MDKKIKEILPWFVIFYPALTLLSTSLSELLLFIGLGLFFYLTFIGEIKFEYPPFFIPILFYIFFSILSAVFSYIPSISLIDMKEVFLYLSIPFVYTILKNSKEFLNKISNLFFYFIILSSSFSAYQFIKLTIKNSGSPRATGFESHYMTQAGIMMILAIYSLTIIFEKKDFKNYKLDLIFLLSSFTLILTLTRSAWFGFALSLVFIFFRKKPVSVLLIPLFAILIYLLSPPPVQNRIKSLTNIKDITFQDRIIMIKKGFKMIKAKPFFGVGPNMVKSAYTVPRYKVAKKEKLNPHLHNNFIQIWAERGSFAFLSWLWFIILVFIKLLKLKDDPYSSLYKWVAIFILIGFLGAGLFEYNFGDSEIKLLLLFFISIPFIGEINEHGKNIKKI
jgi:O-antigen ligase